MSIILLRLLAVAVFIILAGIGWIYQQWAEPYAPLKPVEVAIPQGASTIKIARLLEQQHVVSSRHLFRLLVRLEGVGNHLSSGLYRFEKPATMATVIDRLQRGDVMHFQVTVPEGLRTDEVITLLAKKTNTDLNDWLAVLNKLLPGQSEGRLLPETYQYNKPLNITKILISMIDAQNKVVAELSSDADKQQRLRIMASIVEKETRIEKERPLVAAVIRNRLKKGMPLQMDPTVIYGIWKTTGSFSGNIRRKDLMTNTPWNSYTNRGLPPTPIGNPGAASLRAAATPADVDYLFFVADGTGGHQFATSFADHQTNVKRWVNIERKNNRANP
ncbi:endolytic transglycosylase MltG [Mariprofundus sp. EBB-1]|uniref:endolytic transglycosylase MltG n=1 Tax=Mariprofundus sp. EBB-1 TaxID=2650971 RepID=UPI000EF17BC0|nr:endolytic transglycosylase MltG [Mariprofundus sp. EBB-1]RLL49971.1 endolytic transglycosylase MltG [Mariprofundus sp. EBB-1]